jgi:hypothetical protein
MENYKESDTRTVASKLPTGEFANFKKLCDVEGKTPSGKIRELINMEVDEKFSGLYKSIYDREKIKEFQVSAINDYNSSQLLGDIAKVNLVERTDGKFIQIGLRPLIDEDIFLPEGNVDPRLPSIGRHVAVGERDFLIQKILENEDIIKAQIKKKEIWEFQKENNFVESTIILSTDFMVGMFTALMHRIEYKDGGVSLDFQHKLMFIPGEAMKKRIIIIEDGAILWAKEKFYNEFTDKDESLDISIMPKIGGKVDITVRSVNRIKSLYPEMIKILEIEE